MKDLTERLTASKRRVETALETLLPPAHNEPTSLHQAMRYSVLDGGKRLRAALIYILGEELKANSTALDHCAAAIECVHAFSLIHDDLPCIDDDELRRGKPSCHIKFGESIALLAGDTLHSLSYEILGQLIDKGIDPFIVVSMVKELSYASGSNGIGGGEVMDIEAEKKLISLKELRTIYRKKTSSLFSACFVLAALSAGIVDQKMIKKLRKYGVYLGIVFQIHDDIIGIEGDTELIGKPQFSDIKNQKATYPSVIGLEKSKQLRDLYFEKAKSVILSLGLTCNALNEAAHYLMKRRY